MSNILISLNGECSVNRNQLNKSYDYIFGVDGGTEFLYKLFFIPTHIIGDLDSIKSGTKKRAKRDGAKILSFSVDKDKTDLELALETTKDLNVESITIIGGEGKELDHLFSNFLKLSSFKQHGTIKWITKVENIIFNTQMVFEVEKNKVFSILPLSDLDSLTIKGSKWDILNEDIPYGSSRTLRNITLSNEIEVHCKNGNFCLIIKN